MAVAERCGAGDTPVTLSVVLKRRLKLLDGFQTQSSSERKSSPKCVAFGNKTHTSSISPRPRARLQIHIHLEQAESYSSSDSCLLELSVRVKALVFHKRRRGIHVYRVQRVSCSTCCSSLPFLAHP